MKSYPLMICVGLSLLTSACAQSPQPNEKAVGMANPAATHCIELGGQYRIIDTPDGQAGECLYQGQTWDAWELYRKDHSNK
ncbi:DUF333 domain-containing protein [Shewanella submarina]|uniref:DUF333 domain-containing protein n=1 Tax=Shewanella submarina TaxID=2016376 RepID=A0ABV7GK12_9GAMM|nr:DUF333 domain-containing protein [Shewanella submarina]MCL1036304.1 DUF333 domain-containing protein [Shewanella submarina]